MRFIITPNNEPSIVINDTRGDRAGWYLLEDGINGWFNTPSAREEVLQHPMLDGGIKPSLLTQESREFSLYIGYQFSSTVQASQAIEEINGLFGKDLTITCEDAGGNKEAKAYMSISPEIKMLQSEDIVLATLLFTCPDPHKYSLPVTFAANGNYITVVNNGNCNTWPVINITGNPTQATFTFGGHTVRWLGSASSTSIDFRTGTCTAGSLSVDDAFAIPPGTHSVYAQSDGTITMSVRSAWR